MAKKDHVYKVVVGIPDEGHTLPEAYDNHIIQSFHLGKLQQKWEYEKRNPRYEFYWFTAGRLLTQMAREKLLKEALALKADYILMYDDDMVLPIDMVEKMLEDMEKHPEIDILAPLAFMRSAPHSPVLYTSVEGYDSERHTPYFFTEVVHNYPKDQLVECDAVGFGAVLINLRIIEKMKSPYFFTTTGTGEDVYFCVKAKEEAKARIFMDTRIKLGHIANPHIIDEEYREKYIKDNKVKIEDKPYKYNAYYGKEDRG